MNSEQLLAGLNAEQAQAVSAPIGNLLVLAGAGSGKTRVLVHRIAWVIERLGYSPYSLLAVTFTNKAASEMKHRVQQLLQRSSDGLWLGTFHGIAHRMLRRHAELAGLPVDFQILDADDQLRLIKRLMAELQIDDKKYPPKQALWFINAQKDEGLRPQHIERRDPFHDTMVRIYQRYQTHCRQAGLLDFAELLLACFELLQAQPELLSQYRARFRYLLVDEFQDTNSIQYAWIQLLAGDSIPVMLVGDDDQSIYGWRGARVENLDRVSQDFAPLGLIRLEQNYRSTATILQAANAVIRHNRQRKGKELWTQGETGQPISLYRAFNEHEEARFVCEQILDARKRGEALTDMAILYRSNAQSRVLEGALLEARLPYRIYGGLRFFDRAEIKDAVSYLRLLQYRHDDAAFERVVNVPARGLGDKTLSQIREQARELGISLWASSLQLRDRLPARAANALAGFLNLIERLDKETAGLKFAPRVEQVLLQSGLMALHQQERDEKAQTRLENLKELVSAAADFELGQLQEGLEGSILTEFLAQAALDAGESQAEADEDALQLMTLHAAKGLEFVRVFVVGLEEGIFPSSQSLGESAKLEEERRLCYVGLTRARVHLSLSHAQKRNLYGQEQFNPPSRFLQEIPPELLFEPRGVVKAIAQPALRVNTPGFRLGQRVEHPKFGEGVILSIQGEGNKARLDIRFKLVGTKCLMLEFARLVALD